MGALLKALPAIYANARSECPRCWRRPSARKRGRSTLHTYRITIDLPVATFPVRALRPCDQWLHSCDFAHGVEWRTLAWRSWSCDGGEGRPTAAKATNRRSMAPLEILGNFRTIRATAACQRNGFSRGSRKACAKRHSDRHCDALLQWRARRTPVFPMGRAPCITAALVIPHRVKLFSRL